MKKYILLLCLMICGCYAFSQINKGQWLVGGNAGFSYNRINSETANTGKYENMVIQLSPGTGYFLINKLAAGAKLNFTAYISPKSEGFKYSDQLSLSPFVRYYFLPKAEKVNLFLDASYLYGRTRYRFSDFGGSGSGGSTTLTRKARGYTIAAGPVIFLNPKTALELTINFTKNGLSKADYQARNSMMILGGAGFQIHLGK